MDRLQGKQQVAGGRIVAVDGDVQAAVEGRKIETRIVERGFLPRQVGIGHTRREERRRLRAAEQITVGGRAVGFERTVGRDGVVTRASGAQAQRQFIEPAHLLEEILVLGVPLDGRRREETPFVVLGEVRRPVVTPREGEVVAALVVVVQAHEHRLAHDFVRAGRSVVVLLAADAVHVVPLQVVGEQPFGLQREKVGRFVRGREARHRIEIVPRGEFLRIGDRIFRSQAACVALVTVGIGPFALGALRQIAGPELVVVTLVDHIGVLTLDDQPAHGLDRELQHVGIGHALALVLVAVDLGAGRINAHAVLVEGVDVVFGTHRRGQVDGAVPDVRAADGRPVGILVAEGIAALETDGQPLGEVVRKIQTGRDAAESAAVDDALRIVAAERREVARLLTAAADRKVIVLIESRAGDLVDPVGPAPVLRRVEARRTLRIARGEIVPVVEVADELLRVHQIEVAGEFRDAEFSLGRDRRLRGDALPRGDDNHAVGAARAVDGRRRGVLEDRDLLDVGRVDVVQVAHGVDHAVDDDQRFVRRRDRTRAAHADRSRGSRRTRSRHDVHTGDAALQSLVDRRVGHVADVGHLHVGDRTRQVGFLHRAVTDDHHLVDGVFGIGDQVDVDLRTVADDDLPGDVAQVGD